MTAQPSQPATNPPRNGPPAGVPTDEPGRPWRTEGLPKGQRSAPRRRWVTTAIWVGGYLLLFGVLTVQDRLSGPQHVPYTEFKTQVANKNVGDLFARGDSIEGQLKTAVPVLGEPDRSYQPPTRPPRSGGDPKGAYARGSAATGRRSGAAGLRDARHDGRRPGQSRE